MENAVFAETLGNFNTLRGVSPKAEVVHFHSGAVLGYRPLGSIKEMFL
jgi:hypothetical protein